MQGRSTHTVNWNFGSNVENSRFSGILVVRACIAFIICWSHTVVSGQIRAVTDTTIQLPNVSIVSSVAEPKVVGEITDYWADSTLHATSRSLDEFLGRNTTVFIKSYGSGGISTIAVRGSSAGQTAITWNGMQIMNPMLGLADLSIIPTLAFDNATFSYGGNSAVAGSGAIGGLIAMESEIPELHGLAGSVRSTVGSFGLWNQDVRIELGNGKFNSRTTYSHHQANNNFSYRVRPDLPIQTQEHSSSRQDAIIQDFLFQLNKDQELTISGWWQDVSRQIPPTTVQNASQATQRDENLRFSANWNKASEIANLQGGIGYLYDKIDFQDPMTRVSAISKVNTIIAQFESSWSIDPAYTISGGVNHYYITADIESYDEAAVQNRTAVFATHLQHFRKGSMQINIRQELVDGGLSPFVFSIGGDWSALPWLTLKGKVSRDYRLPGLNDLYWVPGGNPDLKSEKGWSEELTLRLHKTFTHELVEFSATGFNRNINNWILWSPADGSPFWSAQNLAKVHSRGVEIRTRYKWISGDWSAGTTLGYDHVRSTNEVAIDNPKLDEGEQLIYVPIHTGLYGASIGWKALRLTYDATITGQVSTDRGDTMPSYHLANLQLDYSIQLKSIRIQPFAEVLNLWNKDYRVLQYRPMPGRNFKFGIQLKFN